jgi:hypothetical protein
MVDPHRPQIKTLRGMRYACWITNAVETHSACVIPISCPLQQWLHERVSVLRYPYIVFFFNTFICQPLGPISDPLNPIHTSHAVS